MSRRLCFLAVGIAPLLCVGLLQAADDQAADRLFGSGVHAYFAGNYAQAFEQFTTVIDSETDDPRVYYFRGLTCRRLGRPDEAKADFQKGAELEANAQRPFDISQSLLRVQGQDRVMIERYRIAGRVEAMRRAKAQHRARYEAIHREEARVVRADVQTAPVPDEGPQLLSASHKPPKPRAPRPLPTRPTFVATPPPGMPPAAPPGAKPKGMFRSLMGAVTKTDELSLLQMGGTLLSPNSGGLSVVPALAPRPVQGGSPLPI
ncbi:MAG: tetratricopeptide repeat protein, partial [Pirellulales bacterium]|nr:tetratricopeptide repeat protein [Pirellulales bacterium]